MTGDLLRVLMVEDSKADAFLTLRELRRGGYTTLYYHRVASEEAFRSALGYMTWDIVLCGDVGLPFSRHRALKVFKEAALDLPFVFISSPMPEETVQGLLQAGAQDCISRDRLERLVPVVRRELQNARMRQESQKKEQAFKGSAG